MFFKRYFLNTAYFYHFYHTKTNITENTEKYNYFFIYLTSKSVTQNQTYKIFNVKCLILPLTLEVSGSKAAGQTALFPHSPIYG